MALNDMWARTHTLEEGWGSCGGRGTPLDYYLEDESNGY